MVRTRIKHSAAVQVGQNITADNDLTDTEADNVVVCYFVIYYHYFRWILIILYCSYDTTGCIYITD